MQLEPFVDFTGKWVLLSGASSGIGRAIAHLLNSLGAKLIIVGRNQSALQSLAENMGPDTCKILCLDLSNVKNIQPALQELFLEVGEVYGFCHSAGTVVTMPLSASKNELLSDMMLVNYYAGMEMARVVSARNVMVEKGSIVFISSAYAHIGTPGQIAYSASKGAIISAVKAMAIEMARRGIRVNSVSPGYIQTTMTEKSKTQIGTAGVDAIVQKHPLGPGSPEDVARAVVFLLAPQNKWITGTDFRVDGGFTA